MDNTITAAIELAALIGILAEYDVPDEKAPIFVLLGQKIAESADARDPAAITVSADDIINYLAAKYGVQL